MRARLFRLSVLAILAQPPTSWAQQPDYQRAEQFLTWNALRLVYHDQVTPTFYRDSTRFWYRVHTPRGEEFVTVSPTTGSRVLLWDNARLAVALSTAGDTAFDPVKLPFRTFQFDQDGKDEHTIRVTVGKRGFRCDLAAYHCAVTDTLPDRTRFVRSPDDRWDAFIANYNVWIRPVAGGDSVQLTTDGEARYGYGTESPRPTQVIRHQVSHPTVVWSPDSKRLAVFRYDERRVQDIDLISFTSQRPKHYAYPYALPGDSTVPLMEVHVLDPTAKTNTVVKDPPQTADSYYDFNDFANPPLVWTATSDRLYFTHVDRGPKHVSLMEADPATGQARQVLADSSKTYVIGNLDLLGGGYRNWAVLKSGDIIWFSSRDGFGHLYRFGREGSLKNQITSGAWVVGNLITVDETLGRVFFTAHGREPGRHPDYLHLYSVGLDGSAPALLSPEDAYHRITRIPGAKVFLDAYSRVNQPPVTVLRSATELVTATLEKADISALLAIGWRPGEPFTAKARDGITDITGVMWKPSHFDSTRKYPVLDHIYPGPLISPAAKEFYPTRGAGLSYSTFGQVQAIAELGFIVVEMDALGNVARSKAIETTWYGNMGDNGIPDHIAALKQLAMRMRQMDLDRVGIYGHSGGGFSSTDALLRYPEFYKVAVSTSGNHDNRSYYYGWAERFQGLLVRDTVRRTDNYENQANKTQVKNLAGHLLLIHGDMDDNVHPATTIQLVDALIKANKRFDFFILPDANHDLTQNPYVIRRTWDYFVDHLLGERPPVDYVIAPPPPP
jgi:dipeptidyl aminopeptidase/acylaminoacyl peptidase